MIEKIKTKAAELLLKNRLAKLERRVHAKGFREAKNVAILYHYDPETEKLVRDFAHSLKDERLKTDTLAYLSNKEYYDMVKPELSYAYFNKKQLNWLHTPTEKQCIDFMNKEYDIVIDLTIRSHYPLRYLLSLSKAHFKVGAAIAFRNDICDLTIDISKQKELPYLITQLKHYLNLIN